MRALFDRALELDPNDADALAGEANTYVTEYAYGWTNPETDYDAKILGQADRSIALARDNVPAYAAKSEYLTYSLRPNDGLRVADAGLVINPNSAYLYATRGIVETYLRQFEQAKSDVRTGHAAESARSENRAMAQLHGAALNSASAISTPRSTKPTRRSTPVIVISMLTRISPPPTR